MSWPLLVSAAEASGDLLGAALVRELLARRPAMHVCGLAGPELRAAGALAIGRAEDLGVAGLVEVVPALPRVLSLRRRLQAALNEGRPRVGVLIDAPDLHLRLHRAARSAGVRTVQLVAPQFWAWRPGRAKTLGVLADRVLCLFRWEVEALRAHGADAVWVGHPVLERVGARRLGGRGRPRLALLPGSRSSERARNLGAFLAAAEQVDVDVVVSAPTGTPVPDGGVVDARPGLEVLRDCDAALVAPGTATLEATLLGVPTVCAGGLHPVSAWVARRLLATEHVALPNIILGRGAIPEVLQDLSVARLRTALESALKPASAEAAAPLAEELRDALGPPGFGARAADAVLELGDAA